MLPLHVRAKGNALGISAIWLWNFFVVMITPVVINSIQWKAYLIFTVLNFSFVPILYFFYPELSNMTLEEVDDVFTAGINPVKAAKEIRKRKVLGLTNLESASDQAPSIERKTSAPEIVEYSPERQSQ